MHVSRQHVHAYEIYTFFYPTMRYEAPEVTEEPTNLIPGGGGHSAIKYETIWNKNNTIFYKDYFLPRNVKPDQVFLVILSHPNIFRDESHIVVQLMARRPNVVVYGLEVNFKKNRVVQFSVKWKSKKHRVKDVITDDMVSPTMQDPNTTTVRITLSSSSSIKTILNDHPLQEFHLKTNIANIGYVEAAGVGQVTILQQNKTEIEVIEPLGNLVSSLIPLSGGCHIARDNKGNDADCALWREYGYCEELSKYHEYVMADCKRECRVCV